MTAQFSRLPELPFTVGVSDGYALGFLDMLILDGREEAVEEARGEMTGGFLCLNHEAFAVLHHP